jgi:hypothetical protein
MIEKPIFKTSINWRDLIFIILGGIGMGIIPIMMGLHTSEEEFSSIFIKAIITFFGQMSIACIVTGFTQPIFEIYIDRFIVKSIFGTTRKVIFRNDIISWKDLSWPDGDGGITSQLAIFTNMGKYRISPSHTINYNEIRKELIEGKYEDLKNNKIPFYNKKFANYALATFLIGSILLFFTLTVYNSEYNQIKLNHCNNIETEIITAKQDLDLIGDLREKLKFKEIEESQDLIYLRKTENNISIPQENYFIEHDMHNVFAMWFLGLLGIVATSFSCYFFILAEEY